MAAEVGSALGEDAVQLVVLDVERHKHGGVDAAVNVECGRFSRVEQDPAQPIEQ
jgi:hypothetical protein